MRGPKNNKIFVLNLGRGRRRMGGPYYDEKYRGHEIDRKLGQTRVLLKKL